MEVLGFTTVVQRYNLYSTPTGDGLMPVSVQLSLDALPCTHDPVP
jgi:hypothetical protein